MSRYLEYTRLDLTRHVESLPPPARKRLPVCLLGPEEPFREYLVRRYQGTAYTCLGGRVVVGQVSNLSYTFVMTMGPGWYYFAKVLPKYLGPVSAWSNHLGIVQILLAGTIVLTFLLAALTNPGIVPRNEDVPNGLRMEDRIRLRVAPRYLRINDITVKQKFCTTCNVYRPPRSKHCSFCDNCVLRFDHHCTWLGNCIGLHNYRYFVSLIYSATAFLILTIYVVCSVLDVAAGRYERQDGDGVVAFMCAMMHEFELVGLLVYCFFLLVAVLLLSIYHSVISCQNLTTNEHVKNYYRENPFDLGWELNLRQIACFPERVVPEGNDLLECDYTAFDEDHLNSDCLSDDL